MDTLQTLHFVWSSNRLSGAFIGLRRDSENLDDSEVCGGSNTFCILVLVKEILRFNFGAN